MHGPWKNSLELKWSNVSTRTEHSSMRINPTIYDVNKSDCFTLKNGWTFKNLSLTMQSITITKLNCFKHIHVDAIEEYCDPKPEILIGLDNYNLMIPQETVEGNSDEPVAIYCTNFWPHFRQTFEYSPRIEWQVETNSRTPFWIEAFLKEGWHKRSSWIK